MFFEMKYIKVSIVLIFLIWSHNVTGAHCINPILCYVPEGSTTNNKLVGLLSQLCGYIVVKNNIHAKST